MKVDTIGQQSPSKNSIMLDMPTLKNLMSAIAQDPATAANFNAAIATQATATIEQPGVSDPSLDRSIKRLGALQGLFAVSQQNGDIAAAQNQDAVNANMQAWLGAVLGGFGNAALPQDPVWSGSHATAGLAG